MAQLQQQCLGLAAALLLLLAAAATPAGAVGRHLRQAPAAAADGHAKAPAAEPAAALQTVATPATEQPSIYGSPETDACIQLTNSAGQGCTVESDTMSLVYPRGSEQLPTHDQIETAIANMKAAAQPSASCCKDFKPYVAARCPCDPGYQQILPIGGYDAAYFEGATSILAQACGFAFPPCAAAGEVAKPGGH